jgi:hypothetical protein
MNARTKMANKEEDLLEAGVHFSYTRKWDQTWLLTFIWNVMVFTLSIYIKLQQKKKRMTL